MDIRIRKATKRDFGSVLRLNRTAYKEAASNPDFGDWLLLKKPSRVNMLKWFTKLLVDVRKGNAIYFVADFDGQIAGHCFVRRLEPGSELSHVGELAILVDNNYRRKGIGTKLMDYAIRQSKGKFERLRLSVFATNKIAKKLYKSWGFKRFGTEPRAVKRGMRYIDLEHYCLDLR